MTPQELVHDALEVVTFPAAAARVLQLLDDPDVRPGQIAEALTLDPALASRVLRMANSPFFLGASRVDELPRAVMMLGTALLRDLVLGAGVVKAFAEAAIPEEVLEVFWRHSINCGSLAAEIASSQNRRLAEVASTAGLIHDLGELILLIRCPEELRAARAAVTDMRDTQLIYEAERKILGFDHTTVGALLARAWHFPDTLVECMSFHHSPLSSTEGFQELVSIIHIASGCASGLDAEDPEAEPGVAASIDPATWAYANIRPEQIPAFFAGARQRVDAMLGTLL